MWEPRMDPERTLGSSAVSPASGLIGISMGGDEDAGEDGFSQMAVETGSDEDMDEAIQEPS